MIVSQQNSDGMSPSVMYFKFYQRGRLLNMFPGFHWMYLRFFAHKPESSELIQHLWTAENFLMEVYGNKIVKE